MGAALSFDSESQLEPHQSEETCPTSDDKAGPEDPRNSTPTFPSTDLTQFDLQSSSQETSATSQPNSVEEAPPSMSQTRGDTIPGSFPTASSLASTPHPPHEMISDPQDHSTLKSSWLDIEQSKPPDITPDDIVIGVMGMTGAGKTTFISHFADRHVEVGHGLESCTQEVDVVPCRVDNQRIWLIDTPGFDDTFRSEIEVLREVVHWLNEAYKNSIKLTGIIYLHRITDRRVGGVALQNLLMFKKLCGDDGLASVVLATTMWGKQKDQGAEDREKALQENPKFWKDMIKRGSKVFRQDSARKSAAEIINYLITLKRPVVLDIQREMIDKKMKLADTGAGAAVVTEAEKRSQEWLKEVEELRKEIRQANAQRDNDAVKALAEVTSKMAEQQEFLGKLQADGDQLHREMKEKYERKFKELETMIQQKDRQIEEANQLQEQSSKELELEKRNSEKMRMRMEQRERYWKMMYPGTRCIVM